METEILVRKARRGDKAAFLELMLLHKEYMYRTAFIYTRNRDLACDVVQECIIKCMVSISGLKKPGYFKSWMTRILINCALLELRKNKRYVLEPEREAKEWATQEEAVSREEKMDLYEAINRLKYPYNIIIIQKYFFDYQLKEIADLLQMPLGTVKAYHSKAKDQLRICLETPHKHGKGAGRRTERLKLRESEEQA